MKNFFKPQDFENLSVIYYKAAPETAAEIANYKLEKLIESWPVVYGTIILEVQHNYTSGQGGADTHKARLAFIEPIVREPCKHEPAWGVHLSFRENNAVCRHCNIELTATWSAK